jgi:hypothetical protein
MLLVAESVFGLLWCGDSQCGVHGVAYISTRQQAITILGGQFGKTSQRCPS